MAVTLITGGAGGFGRALAQQLTAQGDTVVLADLDGERARVAAQETGAAGALTLDVTDPSDCERVVQRIVGEHGRLDRLACCAGILLDFQPFEDYEPALFARTLQVNLHGTFHACQAAGRAMLAQGGGSIVTVSSGMSERVVSFPGDDGRSHGNPAYGASKAAVEAITRELAVAWGTRGIRVNCVSPGMVATEMSRAAREDPEYAEVYARHTALHRHAEPQELAAVIAFLLSDAASYITAAVVPVEGGYLAI